MDKITPDPPKNDPASQSQSDSIKLNEASQRALDDYFLSAADIKAAPRSTCELFSVDTNASTETLMVFMVETLASIDVMLHRLVDDLPDRPRYCLMGISNSVMLVEMLANRVLDKLEPPA